jgi:hypothetical protein
MPSRFSPDEWASDNNTAELRVTDQHREIAKAVRAHKRHLGELGMIETALAIYDKVRNKE